MPITQAQRSQLSNALIEHQPFFARGVWTFPADVLRVFVLGESRPVLLNMNAATQLDLERLERVAQSPAFGQNADSKCVKGLDRTKFATNIDIANSGLLSAVHAALLGWEDEPRRIEADLDKLHIYGTGAFALERVDMLRDEDDTFGYLVLEFPTTFLGGQLTLRHDGRQFTHNGGEPSSQLATVDDVAWIAFHADVSHAVLPVHHGFRVTLTYRLRYTPHGNIPPPLMRADGLEAALHSVLSDWTFFPDGGRLGFALRHQYSLLPDHEWCDLPASVLTRLRGSDRALFDTANALGLTPRLMLAYNLQEHGVYLLGHPIPPGTRVLSEDWVSTMLPIEGEQIEPGSTDAAPNPVLCSTVPKLHPSPASASSSFRRRKSAGHTASHLAWITPHASTLTRVPSPYISASSDSATLNITFGDVVVIVNIPSKENRAVP